jgi:hypothetical protein
VRGVQVRAMRWGQLEVRVRWSEGIDLRLLFLFLFLFGLSVSGTFEIKYINK